MYLADYHVHSTCSQDGQQTMAQAAQAAVAAGLDELCLTDHVDTVYWGPEQKPRSTGTPSAASSVRRRSSGATALPCGWERSWERPP